MAPKHQYESHLRWTGAARGPTSSYAGYSRDYDIDVDGKATLHGSADPTFRGDASRHNPEDLLVAALSSCHLLSYLALAARAGIHVTAYEDTAVGQMMLQGNGGHFTDVLLRPHVTIARGSDADLALRLHEEAAASCFIAASVNFPVRHEPIIRFADTERTP
jgi:organic hydroperoxide reductase OsmC/OhrA